MARPNKRATTFRTVIILAIVLVLGWFAYARMSDGSSDEADPRNAFAQCLTEKGATMYGAYWCPHCQAQKKQFGKSFSKVTYVECAVPGNSQGQTQQCKDADIQGYPTWTFADGTRVSGEQTFRNLAEKTGCVFEEVSAAPQE